MAGGLRAARGPFTRPTDHNGPMAVDKRAVRLGALALVSVILLGLVGTRLWFLQTVQRQSLQETVERGKMREQVLIPERGRIFDAFGRILADNRRVLTVTVDRSIIRKNKQRTELFTRLSGILQVPVETMEARYDDGRYSQFLPLPVAEDVAEDVVLRVESRSEDFPGVRGQEDWERVYPYAPLASHVVGYLGLILKNQAEEYDQKGYLNNETIGQFGIEKSMEEILHGKWGKVVYEVDSANRVVREVSRREPTPGNDVRLTIDLKLQQHVERLLQTQLLNIRTETEPKRMAKNPMWKNPETNVIEPKFTGEPWFLDDQGVQYLPYPAPAGSVVVENHETGQIIAMASYPTFDNRWFNVGLNSEKFKILFPATKDPDKSTLVNRAIQGQYNLGSTFKPFVAYSAVHTGIRSPGDIFVDTGSHVLNIDESICREGVRCEYFNALSSNTGKPTVYGPVNLESALAVSSDAYFYSIGELAFERDRTLLGDQVQLFGFGADTGIDLPYEFEGRIPTAELKAELIDKGVLRDDESPNMLVGDDVQLAIGQGLLAATPLQLANAYAAIANDGFLYRPHIINAFYRGGTARPVVPGLVDLSDVEPIASFAAPELIRQLDMPNSLRLPIIAGLQRVIRGDGVTDPAGFFHATTGQYLFEDYDSVDIVGKTGTAQGKLSKPWFDSSVFAAFSLEEDAPYTVVAYLEKSGYGSRAAAPLVKCVYLALGGKAPIDDVTLSDPLDEDSLVPAKPNLMPDLSCAINPRTDVRD